MSATVLVVEDTPANLKLVSMLLRREGYAVLHAENGNDAVVLARSHRPDLILMDIQIPGLDGISATQQLKADPATRDLRIVALTAFAMKGDREKMMAAGCDGYIVKPIQYRSFLDEVRRQLAAAPAPGREAP